MRKRPGFFHWFIFKLLTWINFNGGYYRYDESMFEAPFRRDVQARLP